MTVAASGSVSISGLETGLFSTASSTGNAGEIAVSTPTLTMGDSGTISVATSGIGNAGNISLNVSNFTQTGGARVDSSTTSAGQGGNADAHGSGVGLILRLGQRAIQHGVWRRECGADHRIRAGVAPVPTLTMADGGKISVATSGGGSAGSISLNVSNFTQTGGAQVVSSTTGAGAGGTLGLTAGELVSISGAGSGLFSTASSTGNAGQITVSAPALAPVPTLTMADGGKISVATSGAGSAGSILLNANNLSLTGGAQVVSSTTGAGQGGSVTVTAPGSLSVSGSGTAASGLFSTAESTGNAGQITVTTPALTMSNGGTISVATSNIGNAGSISLNVSEFTQTGGGSQVESSTSGAGAGGTLAVTAGELVSISGAGQWIIQHGVEHRKCRADHGRRAGLYTRADIDVGDDGKISVVTSLKESGAGSAGSIFLNANNFSLTGGAQVESSTSGFWTRWKCDSHGDAVHVHFWGVGAKRAGYSARRLVAGMRVRLPYPRQL